MRESRSDESPVAFRVGVVPGDRGVVHQGLLQFKVFEVVGVHPGAPDGDVQTDDDVGHSLCGLEAMRLPSTVETESLQCKTERVHCGRSRSFGGGKLVSERLWRGREEA